MHIDISACGDVPCWVYFNENVSGQLLRYIVENFLKFKLYIDVKMMFHFLDP